MADKDYSSYNFAQLFVDRIYTFIDENEIVYDSNTSLITFPFNDVASESIIEIVDEELKSFYDQRQDKMDDMSDEEKLLIVSNEVLIRKTVKILYEIKELDVNTAKSTFLVEITNRVLDPDYAQNFIDIIANNFAEAEKTNDSGELDNEYLLEDRINYTIEIRDKELNAIYKQRASKLGEDNTVKQKQILSNELFLRYLVQAIHSSNNKEEFEKEIKSLLNPDYALAFITYIHQNYSDVAVFSDDGQYLNGYIKESEGGVIAIDNAYLLELYSLRQQKLEELMASKIYISNELFLRDIVVQNLHKANNADEFKLNALKDLDFDYANQIINYIYNNYAYVVKFDENEEVTEPVTFEKEKIKITNKFIEEYADLRQQKLDELEADEDKTNDYMSNKQFFIYVIEALNFARYDREEYYMAIIRLLKLHNNNGKPAENVNSPRLYPPQIEGALPAFCKDDKITIPFVMNKTVSWNQIKGFALKIKNIQNNNVIKTLETTDVEYSKQLYEAQFSAEDSDIFISGNFYKVQLAYIDIDGTYGYYSTVGIIKCTETPDVEIKGLKDSQLYTDTHSYIGIYSQEDGDVTEKVYSYNFTIYDENGNVLETSGELLHNHENDEEIYETTDSYNIHKALEENKIYTIVYTVTTINGLVKSSPRYRITQQSTIPPEVEAQLIATMNEENGYVDLRLIGNKTADGVEKVGTGTFLICRSSSEDNYGSWSEIDRFVLLGESPSSHNWKDFTVQHGFSYKYSLQQYNQEYQIYSNRMLSNEIVAKFEHSFLYNGKQQLKIKFNPKVSSFKETLLEQKTNTLGGKYPFFFRNGNVRYKEFPISGLISYLSDEEELFMSNEEMLLEDLSHYSRQHTLKENVKGSDQEYFNSLPDINKAYYLQGVYQGRENPGSQENRIANKHERTTNLTDYNVLAERIFKMKVLEFLNDGEPKLFRSPGEGNFIVRLMNSSFSPDDKLNRMLHTFSTTATEIDDFNYQNLNKYSLISISEPEIKQLRWKTINIRELINSLVEKDEIDVKKDTWISIGTENNIKSIQCLDMIPGDRIKISFNAADKDECIIQIGTTGAYYMEFDEFPQQVLVSSLSRQGQITCGYYGTNLNHFDTYKAIKMADIPLIQLHGNEKTKKQDIRVAFNLEDIKYRVTKYYFLNFSKKYKAEEDSEFKFWIDGREIDISQTNDFQLIKPDHIPEIKLGSGITLDASIQRREIEYDVEETVQKVKKAKNDYIRAKSDVEMLIRGNSAIKNYEQQLENAKALMKEEYEFFISQLEKALNEKEVPFE